MGDRLQAWPQHRESEWGRPKGHVERELETKRRQRRTKPQFGLMGPRVPGRGCGIWACRCQEKEKNQMPRRRVGDRGEAYSLLLLLKEWVQEWWVVCALWLGLPTLVGDSWWKGAAPPCSFSLLLIKTSPHCFHSLFSLRFFLWWRRHPFVSWVLRLPPWWRKTAPGLS